jgi:hypothetical protein
MPVQIEEMTSEVVASAESLPLTEAQIDTLVKLVIRRLEAKQREARAQDEATKLRSSAAPSGPSRDGTSG